MFILQQFVWNCGGWWDEEEEEEKGRWHFKHHQHVEKVSEREGKGATEGAESQSESSSSPECTHNAPVPRRCSWWGRLRIGRPPPQFNRIDQWPRPHPSSQHSGFWHRFGLFVWRQWRYFLAKIASSTCHRDAAFSAQNRWSRWRPASKRKDQLTAKASFRANPAPVADQFYIATAVCSAAGASSRTGGQHSKTDGGKGVFCYLCMFLCIDRCKRELWMQDGRTE